MKLAAILLLLCLAFGIMAPPAFGAMSLHEGSQCIGALDVCHTAAPALASDGELPCLVEHACGTCTLLSAVTFGKPEPSFLFIALPVSIDRPPRT